MIIIRLKGGLGNQLFAYSAGRRLSLVNGVDLVIDDVSGFERDYKYKRYSQLSHFNIPCRTATPRERLEPLSLFRRYLLSRLNMYRPFEQRTYIRQEGKDFDQRLLCVRSKGSLYLDGYWQSEKYFKDVEDTIRSELNIAPPQDLNNLAMAGRIAETNNAVALHVRFFLKPEVLLADMSLQADSNNPLVCYYKSALEEMGRRFPDAHYYIFSDYPETAKLLVPVEEDRVTLVEHNVGDATAYADLWLMSQCRHFIIANSTFSWWGAWLSNNPNKVVIAPSFNTAGRVSSWGFDGLIPSEWISL